MGAWTDSLKLQEWSLHHAVDMSTKKAFLLIESFFYPICKMGLLGGLPPPLPQVCFVNKKMNHGLITDGDS